MIARQCAHAVERIELVKAERVARERAELLARRMTALQEIAARLGAARGLDEIARVLVDEGITGHRRLVRRIVEAREPRGGARRADRQSTRGDRGGQPDLDRRDGRARDRGQRRRSAQFIESREAADGAPVVRRVCAGPSSRRWRSCRSSRAGACSARSASVRGAARIRSERARDARAVRRPCRAGNRSRARRCGATRARRGEQ